MKLHVRGSDVVGMPAGCILLFLAIVDLGGRKRFVAVFGPEATCIPKFEFGAAELHDAMIALFDEQGAMEEEHPVHHGHHYAQGGGMAEISKNDPEQGVAWEKAGAHEPGKRSSCFGRTILPECILVAI